VEAIATPTPAVLVSGTHSGVGKTTVSLLLMEALAGRGWRVQPFKVGPDFIDGGYHRLLTGRESLNLDLWMMGLANLRRTFAAAAGEADVAVVEGVGALFDGENGTRERGSSGFVARRLGVPVVLVVDIWGMTRSTHALLDGFLGFDPRVRIAGVVFNRAGSQRHYRMVLDSLPPRLRRLSLGYVPHSDRLAIPERHLGLLTSEENDLPPEAWRQALREAGRSLDVERLAALLRLRKRGAAAAGAAADAGALAGAGAVAAGAAADAGTAPAPVPAPAPPIPVRPRKARPGIRPPRARLGIARDRAFCFYYAENLCMLEQAGAELRYFSPLADRHLPDVDGLYLGGGYPESFAAELAANETMRREIGRAAAAGLPIYAECGGLMYLGRSLVDFDGSRHPMASVLPLDVEMDRRHLAIRYVEVRTRVATPLGPAGTVARGQEFHQSRIVRQGAPPAGFDVTTSAGETYREGFVRRNVLGTYAHLHFRSNPAIPAALVSRLMRQCVTPPARRAAALPRRRPGRR